jgi:alpha-glucosidase
MEKVLDKYAQWGVKGVIVDFMARADQYVVNFMKEWQRLQQKEKCWWISMLHINQSD